MISVNANDTCFTIQRCLTKSNIEIQTSLERLSTGFKINHAADDAANLSISTGMNSQISGLEIAQDNVQQGTSLLQVADGSLSKMQDIAQRIRDLSVQAMNGTYSDEERNMMQTEVNSLVKELYRQKNTTYYNDVAIFGNREKTLDEKIGATDTIGSYKVQQLTEEDALLDGYTVIKDASDFAKISENPSGKYCLMSDINFSDITSWVTKDFTGELNGNGFNLFNYTGTKGLFSTVSGTVKNFTMQNADVNSTTDYTGALCGYLTGNLTNCTVGGTVRGKNYTGGLVGQSTSGTIRNCTSNAEVIATAVHTGGLIGYNYGTLTNCSATGNVSGQTCVGGLIGHSDGSVATITNCYASGDVTGKTNVGGFIANAYGRVENCYATGDVTATTRGVGGFVAINYGQTKNCYALGDVSAGSATNVGGFVGQSSTGTIISCYSTGDVSANGNNIGGFGNGHDVSNSFASGEVTSTNTTSAYAFGTGSVSNCYVNNEQADNIKTEQSGVTGQSQEWFETTSNLTFLGDAYTYEFGRPLLKTNTESNYRELQFQVGANSGEDNVIKIETGFSLQDYSADVRTVDRATQTLKDTDGLINLLSKQRAKMGNTANRFEGVLNSQLTTSENLSSSNSTIIDTDYAKEVSNLTKSQILQNVTASLFMQANTTQSLALTLLS